MSQDRELIRPFGPTIAKVQMSEELIKKLNHYVDTLLLDNEKTKKLDHGKNLAGNVKQEFKLEKDFVKKSGWGEFLEKNSHDWISSSIGEKISDFNFRIIESWIVRQFQNEYNPLHWHGGHISGVGYLKVPNNLGETYQQNKNLNQNGKLQLVHGSKIFLSPSTYTITPKVGDFYFFPNYLMHAVYPFINTSEERRSISFNALISDEIYNVYSN